jgi:hypothetical protein
VKGWVLVFKSNLHHEVVFGLLVIHAVFSAVLQQQKTSWFPRKQTIKNIANAILRSVKNKNSHF